MMPALVRISCNKLNRTGVCSKNKKGSSKRIQRQDKARSYNYRCYRTEAQI